MSTPSDGRHVDLDVAERSWLEAGGEATLWEFIDTCVHWGIALAIVEQPWPVGKSIVGTCSRCGQVFTEPFGPFVERRHKQAKQERWVRCALDGLPPSLKGDCDCNYCRRIKNQRSY